MAATKTNDVRTATKEEVPAPELPVTLDMQGKVAAVPVKSNETHVLL
ncbi:hypothetical protein [Streptomyces sp. NPDC007100]